MPGRRRRSIWSILNDEFHRFVSSVAPIVTDEAIRLVAALASTLRKAIHVLVLAGFGLLTTWAFDLPSEDLIQEWIGRTSVIIIGGALLYDLWKIHFLG
jgi:hypothetical protein